MFWGESCIVHLLSACKWETVQVGYHLGWECCPCKQQLRRGIWSSEPDICCPDKVCAKNICSHWHLPSLCVVQASCGEAYGCAGGAAYSRCG